MAGQNAVSSRRAPLWTVFGMPARLAANMGTTQSIAKKARAIQGTQHAEIDQSSSKCGCRSPCAPWAIGTTSSSVTPIPPGGRDRPSDAYWGGSCAHPEHLVEHVRPFMQALEDQVFATSTERLPPLTSGCSRQRRAARSMH